jgi:uncharacterized YigZ family protein
VKCGNGQEAVIMAGQSEQSREIPFRTVMASDPKHDATTQLSRYEDRKSIFIGSLTHVKTAEEVLAFVALVRHAYPDATHVTYAAVLDRGSAERMSDDGEPSGTAGKQILGILRVKKITDCVVTVTRYFGGTKLGAGGLVRAYSSTAAQALEAAQFAVEKTEDQFRVDVSYAQQATLDHLVSLIGAQVTHRVWSANVTSTVQVPQEKSAQFTQQIEDLFAGRVHPHKLGSLEVQVPEGTIG